MTTIKEGDRPAIFRALVLAQPVADEILELIKPHSPMDGMLACLMVISTMTLGEKGVTPDFVVTALHDVMDVRDAFLAYQKEEKGREI